MFYEKDLNRWGYSGFKGLLKAFFIPGFRFLFLFRLYNKKIFFLKPIMKLLLRFYSRWYGIQIELNANIGPGFYIGHFGTIVVAGDSKIGKNCNISHGVTIGSTFRGTNKGSPVLENEIFIGANAVIVGNIQIGDNVLIAPNSYVNCNIPDNSIVFGKPAIIKKSINATAGYINNKILQ